MMTEQALLITKMVHDLVNPLTSVVNIVDMLTTDQDFLAEALPVLQTAAQNMQKKLKFFRMVYGSPGPINKGIVDDYLTTLSVPLHYTGSCDHTADLGLLGGADVLFPKGGLIVFSEQHALLQANQFSPVITELLQGNRPTPNAKNIMLSYFIQTFGARFETAEQGICVKY